MPRNQFLLILRHLTSRKILLAQIAKRRKPLLAI
jgi:hypothetical protein